MSSDIGATDFLKGKRELALDRVGQVPAAAWPKIGEVIKGLALYDQRDSRGQLVEKWKEAYRSYVNKGNSQDERVAAFGRLRDLTEGIMHVAVDVYAFKQIRDREGDLNDEALLHNSKVVSVTPTIVKEFMTAVWSNPGEGKVFWPGVFEAIEPLLVHGVKHKTMTPAGDAITQNASLVGKLLKAQQIPAEYTPQ